MNKIIDSYKRIKIFFAIFYFSILAYLVFFSRRRRHIHTRYINPIPVKSTLENFKTLPKANAFNFYFDFFGNIAVFIPIAFILIFVFGIYKPAYIILTGFLISFFIELFQYIFAVGYSDIDDIILNTLGAALGYLCFRSIKEWIPENFYRQNTLQ